MKPSVKIHPRADRDLDFHFLYLAEKNREAAFRFLDSAQTTFDQLAALPELGGIYESQQPSLAGIRIWRVCGFENYLVFYRTAETGVEIVRVLHGARDLEAVFDQDE